MHQIGTAAVVVQVTGTNWPKPAYTLLVTGLCRFKLADLVQETPYLVARVEQLDKLLPGKWYQLAQTSLYTTCDWFMSV